jgi:hypothetical protein
MRLCLAGVCAFAAMTAVGCGGGGDNAPTKAAFVKQADGICKKNNKALDQQAHAFFKEEGIGSNEEPTKEQSLKFANEILIPNVEKQVDGVDELTPPKGDEDKVQAVTDSANEAIDKAKQDPTSLFSNKTDPFAKANKLATDYGLKVCGQ